MSSRCGAQNETELAAQLVGFMQQFLNVFAELKGKKFYLTGESVRAFCVLRYQLLSNFLPVCWGILAMSVSSLCVREIPFT
jgi:carboxypeptidase D